ncbi:MAG: phenylacetate--CoA ligase family protein [Deltaproteobacteria bacterium]|nr:phenylacetate--CoA ligase family protein [Deltaproteobacteria bacterium]
MIFEEWIHNRIRETFNIDPEFRQFIGKENLDAVTRKDIEAFQIFRLKKTIEYSSKNSSFYRDLDTRVGKIRSYDDLSKIPFTDPEDLAQSPYKLLCISMSQIARIFSHTTTGTTTGRLKKVFFTHKDADAIIDSMAAIMSTVLESAGLEREGRVVQIFLPNNGPPFSIAGLIAKGAEKFGGIPVIGDCAATTADQIRSIEKSRPTLLMGSAFRIWRITQETSVSHDLAKTGVKAVFITSEYLSRPMRERLEDVWHAEVFHHYGMTEPGFAIGVECQVHDGFHFNEADLLFEIVDTNTGAIIKDEKEGELVLTTLNREGMPLIRYKTGDVATLIRRPCRCGASTLLRIGHIPKRVALIAEIGKQEKIYTSLFDEALYRIPDLVDYRVFLSREDGKDSMLCKVEILGNGNKIKERVTGELLTIPPIRKSIGSDLMTHPEVEIVERGVLRRGGRSLKRRIVDNRRH